MTAYRENAYVAPEVKKLSWWQQFVLDCGKVVIFALCYIQGHEFAHHGAALGWCKHCKTPLIKRKDKLVMVEQKEWERLHQIAFDSGLCKNCLGRNN